MANITRDHSTITLTPDDKQSAISNPKHMNYLLSQCWLISVIYKDGTMKQSQNSSVFYDWLQSDYAEIYLRVR